MDPVIFYVLGCFAAWGITELFSFVTGHALEYRGSRSYAIAYLWSWVFAAGVTIALVIWIVRRAWNDIKKSYNG